MCSSDGCCYAKCHFAKYVLTLGVVMPSVTLQCVIALGVVILSAILLSMS